MDITKQVRVILKDGTEYSGRVFMILRTTRLNVHSKRPKEIICLEVGDKKDVVRIEDSRIKWLIPAIHELSHRTSPKFQ